jgi:hypothetical protein
MANCKRSSSATDLKRTALNAIWQKTTGFPVKIEIEQFT